MQGMDRVCGTVVIAAILSIPVAVDMALFILLSVLRRGQAAGLAQFGVERIVFGAIYGELHRLGAAAR